MKKFLYVFLISCFSLTVISCSSSDDSASTTSDNTTTTDTTAPVIAEVTKVTTPTNDTTPDYTFSSSEAGTISYGGSCSSSSTIAISGNNTITLDSLSDGTYLDCTIAVRGTTGYLSNILTITSFIVDSTAATLEEVTAVTTPTYDTTPDYTFSSNEAGTITYGGSCSSSTTSATTDNNTITLVSLSDGTYSDCTITVTDSAGNVSNSLTITSFTVDTPPTRTYYDLNGITFGNNTFVAVGERGTVRYSSDNGSSWDNGTSGTTREFYEIAYGDNTFVAVGQRGTHSYSGDNGNSWSTGTWSSTNDITGVAFGNNTFIGVSSTYLTKSTDNGSNWNLIGSGVRVYDVTFGNSKFVASGAVGAIQISANNGSNWSSGSSGTSTNTLYGITFGNNKFFSVGNSGKLIISSDNGSTFSNLTSPVTKNIYSVAFGNNIFVGVGYRTVVVSNNNGFTDTNDYRGCN